MVGVVVVVMGWEEGGGGRGQKPPFQEILANGKAKLKKTASNGTHT